ncbi:MAG: zf-HC2 domain-containing protein [Anaerolineae bacterium]|nr:zf-HC2 domain-containing protein [Anaerolineae bacterium]
MHVEIGVLRAYLDDALAPADRATTAAHLASCAPCRAALAELQARATMTAVRLAALDPAPAEAPAAAPALARLRCATQPSGLQENVGRPHAGGLRYGWGRNWRMIKDTLLYGRLRPAAIVAAIAACCLILLSFAPVRQVAADFLGIFRVRKFAVIPLDPAQQQKLENLARQAGEGRFGEPTTLREPGEPQPVADLAEASRLVGFPVRTPAKLPAGMVALDPTIQSGPALRYEMDRAIMEALLSAIQAQGVKLPPTDKIVLAVDVPFIVSQTFSLGQGRLEFVQMASPQVDIPPGVDLVAIGEAGFKFLGIPDADARRLAQSIDWTSTLLIPVPTDVVQYREVTVDGVSGLLIEHGGGSAGRRTASLLWQKNGILYGVNGRDIDPLVVMQVADALR